MTADQAPQRPARPPRSLVQKLAPIVLGFESIVVFLVGLTIFGLNALGDLPSWWAIAGGIVVALLMIVTAGMITKPWAIPFGWGLQVLVALSAFLVPAIVIVVLVFGGMWGYATIMGARLDAQGSTNATNTTTPTEPTATESE